MEISLYEGEVLKKEQINNLKCYFVQNDNSDFQFATPEQMNERGKILEEKIVDVLGFAIVWAPRVILGKVRVEQRGFEVKSYDFPDLKESSFANICQLNAEIIGGESKILRYSETPQAYLSRWVHQKDFKQRHVW